MAAPAGPASDGPRASIGRVRLVMILVGTMLGILFAMLGQTIVSTAMPRVVDELGGLHHYAWVFTGYMLASTVTVPIYGTLSDLYGRRPFFLLGMTLFLLGSALSGLSQDMAQLIVFRAVQGLGAGAMLPIAQAIIADLFLPAERGKWQGLLMAVFGIAAIVGPLAGGWITDHLGWRWAFYVNMPVGVLAMLTAGLALPGQSRRTRHRIDYRGGALLVAAAAPMLLAFSWAGTEYLWNSPQIVALLAFATLMWAAFVAAEARAAEPIISPGLFRNRIFLISVVGTFLVAGGMYGAIMFLPLFAQVVIGESATSAGAMLAPMMLGFAVGSAAAGQLVSRTGHYRAVALSGLSVGAAGMFLLSRMDATAATGLVIRNTAAVGLGIGATMSLFTIVVQNAFPSERIGQVTAGVQFFRSMGGAIGVAVLGTVMANRLQKGLAGAITDVFAVGCALIGLGLVVVLFWFEPGPIKRERHRPTAADPAPAARPGGVANARSNGATRLARQMPDPLAAGRAARRPRYQEREQDGSRDGE